ncbi:hypothetical protein BGW38_000414 [Lunasporangiospora selenospora]|uniref:Proliferation-associated SNF2-like protein n=1 Tax=Lunasporangiospora selenospora TaxID=979761 RepID=A0A9P6G1L8_9FUNG|nr:hypothetical protein BGW38_000414 [Lunasporangiospora selenospora]
MASPTAETENSTPQEATVSTPSSDNADTSSPDGTVTEAMLQEEEKLHEATEKEETEKIAKLKEKAATEYTAVVNKQRFQRLNFLIEKSTLYSGFLAQKLERQQKEARAKAAALEAKRETERQKELVEKAEAASTEPSSPAATATRSSSRLQSKPDQQTDPKATEVAAASAKKKEKNSSNSAAAKKRKVEETGYSIADYLDKDVLKKQKQKETVETTVEVVVPAPPAAPKPTTSPKPVISARQPSLVTGGILRDYQLAGVEWLISLYENGLNGILADEMGLGKTLQTLSFLAFLREKGVWGPFLITAPLSTLANWVNEIERFTPSVPVVLYHGNPEERAHIRTRKFRKLDASFPICVTSYEIVMNDRKYLQKYPWKYIVVDEGHRLKNMNCKLIRELKTYHSANRLLLSGTPLQNNLSELWSLLNFLLPDIFDDLESFQEWFDFSDINAKEGQDRILGEESQSGIVSSLHHILKPFLLRRVKTDVEHSLPKKKEYCLYCPLTPAQKEWYDAALGKDIRNFLIQKKVAANSHPDPNGEESKEPSEAPVVIELLTSEATESPASESTEVAANVEDSTEVPLDELEAIAATEEEEMANVRRRTTRTGTAVSYEEKSDREYFKSLENGDADGKNQDGRSSAALTAKEIDLRRATKSVTNMKLMNVVMQLRKVCNHPFLFDWPMDPKTNMPVLSEDLLYSSGKMLVLNRLLPVLFERGHKVLIFSQFTTMLDIIQDWAEIHKDWPCCRIDGAIKQEDRRKQIADFNRSPNLKLFLLSTRAGGLGINLTSADTVIIFDSDWNPQMDLQAQDRVHRIGQTKPVMVYRLVTANTIEGKIIEKASSKRKLEKLVIQKGKFKQLPSTSNPGSRADRAATLAELADLLAQDDGEKVQVATKDDVVISDKHLEMLLDRSEAAYASNRSGTAEDADAGAATFKVVEETRDDQNDVLKTAPVS